MDSCVARLAALGVTAAGGVAGNPRAAWALARFSSAKDRARGSERQGLRKTLPRPAARRPRPRRKTVADMARAGLKRVGDIAMRPRAPITARFGALPMARLDALKGLERASIAPRFAAPDFCAERRFASPVQTVEAIEATLRKLADDLVVLLERQAKGARRIELALYRVDGDVRRIRVGASRPLNEARAFLRLFAEKLASPQEEAIDAGFGVDLMRLVVPRGRAARALASRVRAGARGRAGARARRSHRPAQREAGAARGDAARTASKRICPNRPSGRRRRRSARRAYAGSRDEPVVRRDAPARPLETLRPPRADRRARRSAGRAAAPLPLAARPARRRRHRGPRAHRRPLVAPSRRADARLFPRRGFARPPLLALPRGPLGKRDEAGEMVRARGVRVNPFSPLAGEGGAKRRMRGERRMRARRGDGHAQRHPHFRSARARACAPSRRKRRENSGALCATVACRRSSFGVRSPIGPYYRRLRLPSLQAHRRARRIATCRQRSR